jgi:hypothetical protein
MNYKKIINTTLQILLAVILSIICIIYFAMYDLGHESDYFLGSIGGKIKLLILNFLFSLLLIKSPLKTFAITSFLTTLLLNLYLFTTGI